MKYIIVFFFLLEASCCLADKGYASSKTGMETADLADFKPNLIIEPPMALSQDLPITISTANRRAFITNDKLAHEAAAYNMQVLQAKTIPWQFFSALITLSVLIIILKSPVIPSS